MLNKIAKNKAKILSTMFIVFCFALIRAFEKQLFYDPFLKYFETDFKNLPLPDYSGFLLFLGILLRYILNTILSLGLIYLFFRNLVVLKFSIILYLFFLMVLFGLFFLVLTYFPEKNWTLFYIRRFIIQPIFVLLFIPAFYYQQEYQKRTAFF